MYYTPDGRSPSSSRSGRRGWTSSNAQTMKLVESVPVPCRGVDHMDFSADGRYLIASCEFAATLVKVDVATRQVLGTLAARGRRDAAGRALVARRQALLRRGHDGQRRLRHRPVCLQAVGIHPDRQRRARHLRSAATRSCCTSRTAARAACRSIDVATRKPIAKWEIPGGGSPDMGGVSADGKMLWLSGRYHREVYAFDTRDGQLLARIKVGQRAARPVRLSAAGPIFARTQRAEPPNTERVFAPILKPRCKINFWRVLSANSPTGCSAKSPGHG